MKFGISFKKRNIFKSALCLLLCAVFVCTSFPVATAAKDEKFFNNADILKLKSHIEYDAKMSKYATAQGSCSDGKFAYFAVQSGATTLLKYDLSSWKLVKRKSGIVNLGHANDMTYNSKADVILVANNAPDYNIITVVDPKSLKVIKSIKIKLKIYSIAYNEEMDCYVVGISNTFNFAIMDSKFKVKKKFKGITTGYTRQGCDCDENYIYFSQSGGNNIVVIYDYSGNHVATILLSGFHEVENIFHAGNSFFATLHHYGNFLYRVALNKKTKITYSVNFDPTTGSGVMSSQTVAYGKDTQLNKCSFTKPGYLFGGWRVQRSSDKKFLGFAKGKDEESWLGKRKVYNYKLFKDEGTVSKTVKFGSITLSAFWINEYYDVSFNANGATGYIDPFVTAYADSFTLPENRYYKQGFVFSGYSAYRTYDDRYYGYRKKSKKAEWLDYKDLFKKYTFSEGEKLKKMTYDGSVVFTAEFRSAFSYDESKTVLVDYSGIDSEVVIPDDGNLKEIASNAFSNSDVVTTVRVPSSVETVDDHAFASCRNLESITFFSSIPQHLSGAAIVDCNNPEIYLEKDGKHLFLGWLTDPNTCAVIQGMAASVKKARG